MSSNQQILKRIDEFLIQQKVKYLDVRSELLDHLATEFDVNSNYVLVDDFLNTKTPFIKKFARSQQKVIHWSYQKQLWMQFAKFFYKPKHVLFLVALVTVGYYMLQNLSVKTFTLSYFFVMSALILYPLFYQIKYSKAVKQVQSFQSLFSVLAIPSLFLYCFTLVKNVLIHYPLIGLMYFGFAILLGISAIHIIERDRKKILEKYNKLIAS